MGEVGRRKMGYDVGKEVSAPSMTLKVGVAPTKLVCRWLSGSCGSCSVVLVFPSRSQHGYSRAEGGLVRRGFVAASFWSRGHASVEGVCCWGPPDEISCLRMK